MGLRGDLDRFREVGEQRRQDLEEFIRYGDLEGSGPDSVRIPIKIVDLPEFAYDPRDAGGVGQARDGDPEVGQPVEPQPGEGDEAGDDGDGDGDEAGEGGGEHGYYEMDPEEFAEALDETLGLDLEPKGKTVRETVEGDYTERTRAGPHSTLDVDRLFKEGLKRALATGYDEGYLEEACRVAGADAEDVFTWVRERGMPISRAKVDRAFESVPASERGRWRDFETMDAEVERTPPTRQLRREGFQELTFRKEDERYRYPEVTEKRERNVVVVNIRDVSGSMREEKRELVERTFAPLDWYLQGKYDRAEFVYIAHDAEAWEVDREDFFGIRSGGGTRISSAYELAAEVLAERYPWAEWNRYVFAAGDGENAGGDTEQNVVPLMREMAVNRHAYVETRPGKRSRATHASDLEDAFDRDSEVVVARIADPEDVTDAIQDILATDAEGEADATGVTGNV